MLLIKSCIFEENDKIGHWNKKLRENARQTKTDNLDMDNLESSPYLLTCCSMMELLWQLNFCQGFLPVFSKIREY